MLYSSKTTGFILHPYLPITSTCPQRPLSSVPKVAVVERFDCNFFSYFTTCSTEDLDL